MILLTWIGLIKSTKEPGKLLWQAVCGSELHEYFQYFHFNGINGSTNLVSVLLHNFIRFFPLSLSVLNLFFTNEVS